MTIVNDAGKVISYMSLALIFKEDEFKTLKYVWILHIHR